MRCEMLQSELGTQPLGDEPMMVDKDAQQLHRGQASIRESQPKPLVDEQYEDYNRSTHGITC